MTYPTPSHAAPSGSTPVSAVVAGPPATGSTTTRRVFLLIGAGISLLLAILLLASGTTGLWQLTKRDSSGFFTSNTKTLSTNSYAITSDTLDIGHETPRLFGDHLGTVQIRVSSDKPVFIGIARTSDVERYLARVNHQAVTDFQFDPFSVTYADRPGTARPEPPAAQSFWHAKATGTGTQTIRWPLEKGNWSAVAMNADGSRHVVVDTSVGARIPALRWVVVGLLSAGGILLLIAVGLAWSGMGLTPTRRR
jgi:hypothetical protein